mmetsp:Transcript_33998/g.106544  ORF Transcript_33998/g.106544 Transcript_33998/m.106544 type:complete len:129 (-) Transcript_33998:899-1285(-)
MSAEEADRRREQVKELLGKYNQDNVALVELMSCKTKEGLDNVVDKLRDVIQKQLNLRPSDVPTLTRPRHRHHLTKCVETLEAFITEDRTADMAAEQLRQAVKHLGSITGAVGVEEILDKLFVDFCIGK